jgi:hypothetical protein
LRGTGLAIREWMPLPHSTLLSTKSLFPLLVTAALLTGCESQILDAGPDASSPSTDANNADPDAKLAEVDGGQADAYVFQPPLPISNVPPDILPPAPGPEIVLKPLWEHTINTDAETMASVNLFNGEVTTEPIGFVHTQAGGIEMHVIYVEGVNAPQLSKLVIVGSRPLAIISTGDMWIEADIYSTGVGSEPGAGGNGSACATGHGADGSLNANFYGSGGGGGAFGSGGGQGRPGLPALLTPGGTANGTVEIIPLRGGCAGGKGAYIGGTDVPGGGGGGALQLTSFTKITLTNFAQIRVGGGGGAGGPSSLELRNGSGAGGGSGGAILLEAAESVVSAALLSATGGGGGGGSRSVEGVAGSPGEDGDSFSGGSGGATGGGPTGDGGEGASFEDGLDAPENSNRGGGGGGGGVGRIRINAKAIDIGSSYAIPEASTNLLVP